MSKLAKSDKTIELKNKFAIEAILSLNVACLACSELLHYPLHLNRFFKVGYNKTHFGAIL